MSRQMGAPYGLTHAKQLRVAVVQLNLAPPARISANLNSAIPHCHSERHFVRNLISVID
jgi:hypothetical protein